MRSPRREEEEVEAVREMAEVLDAAWGRGDTSPAIARRFETATERLIELFPACGKPHNIVGETLPFGARPIEDALADLRLTGPYPVRLPLWERLWHAAGETADDPSVRVDFNSIGLGFFAPPLCWGGYHNSPLNAATFAFTGGGGDHFSLLPIDGVIGPISPVVLTVPDGDFNVVVARNLEEFLRVGFHCGFFQYLENFAETYAGRTGWWFGDEVEPDEQELLRRLADRLDLESLSPSSVDRETLDAEFLPRLHFL